MYKDDHEYGASSLEKQSEMLKSNVFRADHIKGIFY